MKIFSSIILFNLVITVLYGQVRNDSIWVESELILKTSSGDIYGTLTTPRNSEKSPLVLIIAGSGPTDRNCNSPMGLQTNAYKMVAEKLASNNISSLRFDKRGIGQSRPAMTSENELRFETYINDAVAWISLLKADRRFSEIIILGHSEGSLIGMIAAEQANCAGFISVAGIGKSADKVLLEQLKPKLSPQLFDESSKILDTLKMGKTVSGVNPMLVSLFRPSVQPYMISWIKYDPAQEIEKLKIPVMIIQGTCDLQVGVDNAKLLASSKPDAKVLVIENMNHVLKESDMDMQKNMATYRNPDMPLKDGLIDEIVRFITLKK